MIGIDEIIKRLRPGAKFELINMEFAKWEHELPPPTWDEINEIIEKDNKKYIEMGGEIIG